MIAIIMPTHNGGEHIEHAINSIIQNTKPGYRLIIIESESTDGTDNLVDKFERRHPSVIKVYHTKKEGLIKAINFGIKKAEEMDVYLTQDDVIIPKLYGRDWLVVLNKVSKLQNCGLVSTIRGGGISGPDYIDGLYWVGTWSMYIPRRIINEIGLFDEKFSPGCGDDIDYSYRIQKAGYVIYEANFWVDHHRSGEHFNDSEKLKQEHSKYFKEKWKL